MQSSKRILLLAHGSSDQRWCQTFETLAAPTLESLPESRVAYMELAEPSLEAEIEKAAADGIHEITVVPLFLAAGRHLRKDVPAMLEQFRDRYSVAISLLPPIGEDPRLGEALKDIVRGSLEQANG